MDEKNVKLTKSEEQLMEIFWNSEEPITSVEITNMKVKPTWSSGLVHNMLRALLKKSMIEECGTVQYGTQYARRFIPSVTKEEYAARLVLATGIDKDSISKVMVALVKETGDNEEVIAQLEDMIKQLREE